MRSVARRRLTRFVLTSDAAVVVFGSAAAADLTGAVSGHPARVFLSLALCAGALLAGLAVARAHTRVSRRIAPVATDELGAVLAGFAVAVLALTTAVSLTSGRELVGLRPLTPLVAAGIASFLVPLGRWCCLSRLRRDVGGRPRVIVVGSGRLATEVSARLWRSGQVELVGCVDDEPAPYGSVHRVIGTLSELGALCERLEVDRVVVAFSRSHPSEALAMLRDLPEHVTVDVVPRYFEMTGWSSMLDDVGGLTLVSLGRRSRPAWSVAAKRGIDVVIAAVGLMIACPALAAAAILIRLDSPGPVLFCQPRYGKGRRVFCMVKLRTMATVPWHPSQGPRLPGTNESDPRITRVGRVLRRLGIDELPQLVNVLAGQMSIVGPRPLVPAECDALPEWANRRFEVRPGLTGMWQVCGQHDLSFDELCRLDYQYATGWTISADLRIVVRTPARLLRGGGGTRVLPPVAGLVNEPPGEELAESPLLALPTIQLDPAGIIAAVGEGAIAEADSFQPVGD